MLKPDNPLSTICFYDPVVFLFTISSIDNKKVSIKIALDLTFFLGAALLLACTYKGYNYAEPDEKDLYTPLNGESKDIKVSYNDNLTPLAKAGFFHVMSFWWLNPLMKTGNEKTLEEKDMPKLCIEDRAESCYLAFVDQYNNQKHLHPSPSILRTIVMCNLRELLISGFFALMKIITVSSGPLFLKAFIRVAEGDEKSLSQRQWDFRCRLIGIRVRSLLTAAIYKKQLKLSNAAKITHSAGEIINYATVDAYRIGEFPSWLHQSWTTILQLLFALLILLQAVGLATFAALGVIILSVLCNMPLAKLQHKFQSKLMVAQDERLKAVSEALVNMKVLKLYAWEIHFKGVIEKLRQIEYKWLSAVQLRRAYNSFLFWSSPLLVSTATFGACYLIGIPLNASNVFTFVATLRLVQDPIRTIPDVIGIIIQAKVAFSRILNFLEAPELESAHVRQKVSKEGLDYNIFIDSASLSWDGYLLKPTLRKINLRARFGQKIAICGEVGSGKSTLLAGILGEVPIIEGTYHRTVVKLQVYGSIAYVSQSAWIQTGSIRDNILFGSGMDDQRYQETLKKCSLVKDLELLPYGDLTEIGERGVNLSGGQKQRIQLARALYQDADIYLLDDPFSAVDAHTASSLFNEYVMDALSRKTVLLVTHQVDFLPAFDSVLLMSDGEILAAAPYNQLMASSQEFQGLVNAHKETAGCERLAEVTSSTRQIPSIKDIKNRGISKTSETSDNSQLIRKEEREEGDAGFRPYIQYLNQNKGYVFFSIAALSHVTFVACNVFQNSWMAANVDNDDVSTLKLIVVYLAIGVVAMVFLLVRSLFTVALGLQSSKSIFSQLLTSLFRVPMSFYDSTPLGRVLSRVSVDLSIIDLDIPFNLIFAVAATTNFYTNTGVFASNNWLIQRLETISATVLSASGLCMVLLPPGTFSSGFIGMAMSYGLSLNMSLVMSIQNQCTLVNYIISVERVNQYMHLPSEAPLVIEENRPPPNWPNTGKVDIQDLKIRYRPDAPLVLRGVTCTFQGGHKIGIVGRTGSGKTTLIGALFRLPAGGKIVVDGIDISTVGLHDLRSQFGVIPQDPTLFNGTVRYNLDPLCQHSDHEIWEVLGKCQLREAVQDKTGGLDSIVVEDGTNWSMGQRQLFCLGRALLRRSKILVLDEATASVDNATDTMLQETIRSEFADCTVITVAHRIPTVMDCTMVLTMSDGKIAEYDEPMKLMKRDDSLFGQLLGIIGGSKSQLEIVGDDDSQRKTIFIIRIVELSLTTSKERRLLNLQALRSILSLVSVIDKKRVSFKMALDLSSFLGASLLLACTYKLGYYNYEEADEKDLYTPLNAESKSIKLDYNENLTPRARAGFLNVMSFWWLNSLMITGSEKTLEEKDMPNLCIEDRAESCYLAFVDQYNNNNNNQKQLHPSPSILKTIVMCNLRELLISGLFALMKIVTVSAGPLFLKSFIRVAEGDETFIGEGVRSLLTAAIYKKQLKLSNAAKITHSAGEIMNYATVDAYRIGEFPYWLHQSWTTALQLLLALLILLQAVGLATFAALAVIILTVVCNMPLAKLQHKIPLNASNVFTFVATLRLVQDPIRTIPDVIGIFIQAKVAFSRILNFLEASELETAHVRQKVRKDRLDHNICIGSATLSWDGNLVKPTLRNINLQARLGEKIAICGEVGSGKSTLLAAILGEVPITEGTLQVYGSIAYVSQSAWIQTGSIRDNILFGSEMDDQRYQEALSKCCLVKDLELLPYGDLTEIGERGVNLSGGQKQRIQLARALYQDADIYLLDDPFSAVDAHTASSLFNEFVMEALSWKTVLLVTHQVDFLPSFDSVLLMSDGEILAAAPYNQLMASCQEFQDLVNAHKETAGSERLAEVTSSTRWISSIKDIKNTQTSKISENTENGQLIKKEEREEGDTGFRPYIQYLNQNKGYVFFSIAVFSQVAFVVCNVSQNSWLAANLDNDDVSTLKLILVYLALGVGAIGFLLVRSISTVALGLQSSKSIFSQLLISLFRVPMSFYDSTPLGRVLSRVAVDLSIIDLDIPFYFMFVLAATTNFYMNTGVLVFVTWQVLFVSIPLFYVALRL
ncbi:hypothetical protein M8C21_007046, partial [Ambrosia artemisiifolia]